MSEESIGHGMGHADYLERNIDLAHYAFRRDQAEIEIWRKRHPREADQVAEEAAAKIEGREPIYGPAQAYG